MPNTQPIPEEAIRRRAQQLFEQRGRIPGHEVEDWLQGEAELARESQASAPGKSAFVMVKLDGVTYTGEYDSQHCDGYQPGEFASGAPTQIRFERDKMYIQRPNGKELETKIVKQSPDLVRPKAG